RIRPSQRPRPHAPSPRAAADRSSRRSWERSTRSARASILSSMPQSPTAALALERSQLEPVFAYVDQHADEFVERLRRLCRQPSVVITGALPWDAAAKDSGASPEGCGFRSVSFHYLVSSNEAVDDVIARRSVPEAASSRSPRPCRMATSST